MIVMYRLFKFHRKSGASFRSAIARAWRKWREPDPFTSNPLKRSR